MLSEYIWSGIREITILGLSKLLIVWELASLSKSSVETQGWPVLSERTKFWGVLQFVGGKKLAALLGGIGGLEYDCCFFIWISEKGHYTMVLHLLWSWNTYIYNEIILGKENVGSCLVLLYVWKSDCMLVNWFAEYHEPNDLWTSLVWRFFL